MGEHACDARIRHGMHAERASAPRCQRSIARTPRLRASYRQPCSWNADVACMHRMISQTHTQTRKHAYAGPRDKAAPLGERWQYPRRTRVHACAHRSSGAGLFAITRTPPPGHFLYNFVTFDSCLREFCALRSYCGSLRQQRWCYRRGNACSTRSRIFVYFWDKILCTKHPSTSEAFSEYGFRRIHSGEHHGGGICASHAIEQDR